ncbi:unnamed protein product [Rotaria socialis]|uniref:Uncharacterized protein n=1 Tax=Rotaria socialis TaxID=392032 RepID=A0A817TVD6_9BILA|nr:unnamed protein product [Rotaria socialis]CAF3322797.1 unnamed protein product [Rotaria socialis]CAF3471982.1 unnamed protein product [Rotaria socialis]CAF3785223.1 unnamed protein product [Rotaria socialis]
MPWRSLIRYLSNNEELIRRLSESYPIRRAAQLAAYYFHASKDKFIEQKDTWSNYKELRRQQEKTRTSSTSSTSTTTKATTKNKKPFT